MSLGQRSGKLALAGALLAALPAGAAITETPRTPPAAPPAPTESKPVASVLRYLPKARRLSTYTIGARFEVTTKDVTFEAPPAYKEGFDFWSGRMKGQKVSEVYELKSVTQDADAQGLVPFELTIPKFDLESQRNGELLMSPPTIRQSVSTLVFAGVLDPLGNVKEFKRTFGTDDPAIKGLAIAEVTRLFPEVDGPRDLRIGDSFTHERVVHLPTKLTITGLEDVTLKVTRVYVLKSLAGGVATFEVRTTYADDPAFKPGAEKTTVHISGSGSGQATFEIARGVYESTRMITPMHIDLEAPLRPLPNHPETESPATGKTHIDLEILLSGQQTVKRTWGEEQD